MVFQRLIIILFSNFITNFHWLSRVPNLHMNNTLPADKKVSDCPLTLSEPVPKKGLSVEALESRRTNIGVARFNVLFTTYNCVELYQ